MKVENTITINGNRCIVEVAVTKNENNDKYSIVVNGKKQPFECIDYPTALFFCMGIDAAFQALRAEI